MSTMPQALDRAVENVSYLGDLPAANSGSSFLSAHRGGSGRQPLKSPSNILSNLMRPCTPVDEAGKPLLEIAMSFGSLGGSENIILQFQKFR